MLKVGITGGIGSGKSTVCNLFALYGIAIYNADVRAKELMNSDENLIESIIDLLGTEAYNANGELDRGYVARMVFGDTALLSKLNALVHPAVAADFLAWADRQEGLYVLQESAILFESGFDRLMDRCVTVSAPKEVRLARTVGRDGCTVQSVRQRMAAQMEDAQREKLADFTIINDGVRPLLEQVEGLHKIFCSDARRR